MAKKKSEDAEVENNGYHHRARDSRCAESTRQVVREGFKFAWDDCKLHQANSDDYLG